MKERPHTKKPIILPTPNIRAAQALPRGCSDEGIVSTRRARSTDITTTSLRMLTSLNLDPTMLTSIDRKIN